jgi:hypothetical protein
MRKVGQLHSHLGHIEWLDDAARPLFASTSNPNIQRFVAEPLIVVTIIHFFTVPE